MMNGNTQFPQLEGEGDGDGDGGGGGVVGEIPPGGQV